MDTTLKYVSNNGTSIEFKPTSSYHYNGATLHDYSHSYTTSANRITSFYSEVTEFDLDVVVAGSGSELRNAMTEAFEYDVAHLKAGKLWSGDYYLECYVTASQKDMWWQDGGYMKAKLTVTAESPKWVRENYKMFGAGIPGGTGIDYSHDWSFDYVSNVMIQDIENTGFVPAAMKINVYGPVSDGVSIVMGGTTYAVDQNLTAGQVLTIDGRSKSITVTDTDGTKTSVFNKRVGEQVEGSGEYVFEKVPSGTQFVSWDSTYSFDATVYDERSEPKW